jgi:ketosteroid isomerase-like protein
MKKNLFITGLTLVVFFGFVNPLIAQDRLQEITIEIKEINRILEKATMEGDYETLLKYYDQDIIVKPDFSEAVRGKGALREQYRKDKQKGVKIHSFSGVIEALWYCGDEVYERGTFGLSASSDDSPQPTAMYGSYFQIWTKQKDNSYKIKYVIWNLDYNPFKSGN